jgi:hypothetical protein
VSHSQSLLKLTYVCFLCAATRLFFVLLYWLNFDLTSLSIPPSSCTRCQLKSAALRKCKAKALAYLPQRINQLCYRLIRPILHLVPGKSLQILLDWLCAIANERQPALWKSDHTASMILRMESAIVARSSLKHPYFLAIGPDRRAPLPPRYQG